jgi:hypothetical protein
LTAGSDPVLIKDYPACFRRGGAGVDGRLFSGAGEFAKSFRIPVKTGNPRLSSSKREFDEENKGSPDVSPLDFSPPDFSPQTHIYPNNSWKPALPGGPLDFIERRVSGFFAGADAG